MVTKTAAAASYEEKRKKRLEENKKRMMQLNIPQLSQALKPSPAVRLKRVKPKPKPDTTLVNAPLRRSTRMADKPPPDYHEFILVGGRGLPLRRNLYSQINASNQNRLYAIQRAQELELRLGSQHPTFVKALLQAHVVGNLNLPTAFCKTHLLNYDGMLTLVDEDGKKCQTKFHLRYNGLGSGWRGFAIDHHLVDGDVLVFQLIEPTTLKFFNGYPYHGGSFEQSYRCYPASFIEKPQIESGDKIIMPPSALDRLASLHIDYPMLFELRNDGANRVSHCGVLEFIAEEGMIYMPYWMMENMLLQEGDIVRVKSVSLPKGTYVKLQPHTQDFLDISNPKAILETTLRNYSCLTSGDSIMVAYNNKKYYIDIIETNPSHAISIIETDCEVDFAPPLDYKEPERPAVSAPGKAPAQDEEPPAEEPKFNPFTGVGRRLDGKPALSAPSPASTSVSKDKQPALASSAGKSAAGSSSRAPIANHKESLFLVPTQIALLRRHQRNLLKKRNQRSLKKKSQSSSLFKERSIH